MTHATEERRDAAPLLRAMRMAPLTALLLTISVGAWAQRPSPADNGATVPQKQVETGLEAYNAFADEPLKDWAQVNRDAYDAAVEMGMPGTYATGATGGAGRGHAGHGAPKPTQTPTAPPSAKPPAPMPQSSGHGGHMMK